MVIMMLDIDDAMLCMPWLPGQILGNIINKRQKISGTAKYIHIVQGTRHNPIRKLDVQHIYIYLSHYGNDPVRTLSSNTECNNNVKKRRKIRCAI